MKQWRAVLPHRRGCRWGVTGMLLAVPITAVLRIHLSHIYHPLPRWIAALLVGSAAVGAAAARRRRLSAVVGEMGLFGAQ